VAVAARLPWLGAAQVTLAPVALVLLGLVACGLESSWPGGRLRGRIGAALRQGAALPAGALASLLLVTPLDRGRGSVRFLDDGEFAADVEAVELDVQPTDEREPPEFTTEKPANDVNGLPGERGNDEARLCAGTAV
jgi:hypothetical protein